MGAVLNPIGVSLAAGFGAAIGELSGYLAGFSGQGIVEKTHFYNRVHLWMENNPKTRNLFIMVMAFIPNPLFDMAGMAAGALKIPVIPFMFWVSFG